MNSDMNVAARRMVDEGLVSSMAEARRYTAAGVTPERLKELRANKSQPLRARRDYGADKQASNFEPTAYIDRLGWDFEVRLPNNKVVKAGSCDDAYVLIQRYAMKSKEKIVIVDIPRGVTREVDAHGNIQGGKKSMEVSKTLDMAADRLEAHGMRKAAERLDTISNTIEAGFQKESADLANKPYVVEQLNKEGFDVTRYPGNVESVRKNVKGTKPYLRDMVTYDWRITAPTDKVFNIGGIEQEEAVLNTPASGYKEEDFKMEEEGDYKYLVMTSHPRESKSKGVASPTHKIIAKANKEQDLILQLKRLLRPAGSLKTAAAKYLDPSADEMRKFLKKEFSQQLDETDDIDVESAIYWFANDYHGGQSSDLYSALSTSKFKPGPTHRSVKDEGEVASMMYDSLKREYGG